MKSRIGLLAMLSLAAGAQAVNLNTDALKSMQEEGHKIVEQAGDGRFFRSNTGQCLDIAGKTLLIKACDDKATSQLWRFDDQGRLAAHDGRCVGDNAQLQACNKSKEQQWKLDGKQRLANGAGQCLQPQGNPPEAGAKIAAVGCSGAGRQVWK